MAIHTDGHGNLTTRTYSGGGYTSTPYQAAPQQVNPDDPFAQYANAFQSIIPPDGVPVQPVAPVSISSDGVLLSNYDKFLTRQGINPNTIGTATLDPGTGRMIVPSVAQEYAAVNANNQENALEGDLRKAARLSWRKGDTDRALEYEGQVRELNNARGGSSHESRLRYFLNMAQAASPPPIPSANGFS